MVILFFITVNFFTLSVFERRLVTFSLLKEEKLCPASSSPKVGEEVEQELLVEQQQVISMEEDGRLGNLLIETATLFLIGRQANVTVSLLPQVGKNILLSRCLSCTGWEKAVRVALPAASASNRPQSTLYLRQVHRLYLPCLCQVDKSTLLEIPSRPWKVPGSICVDTVVPL